MLHLQQVSQLLQLLPTIWYVLQEKGEQNIFTFSWHSEQLRLIFYQKPLKMSLKYCHSCAMDQ